jgi:four helix bundle protein
MKIVSAKDLTVYQRSYALGMRIFEVTKRFPPEERYALTGQLRRSGRSPCRSLREAWAKRRYRAHFISKPTDADGEKASPIRHWTSLITVGTSRMLNMRKWLLSARNSVGC